MQWLVFTLLFFKNYLNHLQKHDKWKIRTKARVCGGVGGQFAKHRVAIVLLVSLSFQAARKKRKLMTGCYNSIQIPKNASYVEPPRGAT